MNAQPIRSYARTNRELVEAFTRYLVARGNSAGTVQAYNLAVTGLVDWLGSRAVGSLTHTDIRLFLGELLNKGLDPNSLRLRTSAIRALFKFARLAGLTKYDPTAAITHRKIPRRIPRVLTVAEVKRLIDAASNLFERAIIEFLYGTGCRVSEVVKVRLEDVDFSGGEVGSVRVKCGKGRKDRVVLFGRKAADAIRDYQAWRPSQAGYLFEAPARTGRVYIKGRHWYGRFYVGAKQREISVGSVVDLPTLADARKHFERIAGAIPGFTPISGRPCSARAICNLVHRLGHRAGLGRVHPHMLRRAFACHLLQSGGDLRAIQELLGHANLTTTMLYTSLTVADLKRVHETYHPHGGDNATKKD